MTGAKVGLRKRKCVMREYLITVHKVLPDGSGHDRRTLQRQVVVAAPSGMTAVEVAKTMFCEAAGIVEWRWRDDGCEVTEFVA